ncbi:hypothetical protein Bbelb_404680 [Branchiostoma belcheri]|nr:hypothetical protein Bbelb_404680 [Branchiostoma belcheri]
MTRSLCDLKLVRGGIERREISKVACERIGSAPLTALNACLVVLFAALTTGDGMSRFTTVAEVTALSPRRRWFVDSKDRTCRNRSSGSKRTRTTRMATPLQWPDNDQPAHPDHNAILLCQTVKCEVGAVPCLFRVVGRGSGGRTQLRRSLHALANFRSQGERGDSAAKWNGCVRESGERAPRYLQGDTRTRRGAALTALDVGSLFSPLSRRWYEPVHNSRRSDGAHEALSALRPISGRKENAVLVEWGPYQTYL